MTRHNLTLTVTYRRFGNDLERSVLSACFPPGSAVAGLDGEAVVVYTRALRVGSLSSPLTELWTKGELRPGARGLSAGRSQHDITRIPQGRRADTSGDEIDAQKVDVQSDAPSVRRARHGI